MNSQPSNDPQGKLPGEPVDLKLLMHVLLAAIKTRSVENWCLFDLLLDHVSSRGVADKPDFQHLDLNDVERNLLKSQHGAIDFSDSSYNRRRYGLSLLCAAAGYPHLFKIMTASIIERASIAQSLEPEFEDSLSLLPIVVLSPTNQRFQTPDNEETQTYPLVMYLIARSIYKTKQYDDLINKAAKGFRDGYSLYLGQGRFAGVVQMFDSRPSSGSVWITEHITNSLYAYLVENTDSSQAFSSLRHLDQAVAAIGYAIERNSPENDFGTRIKFFHKACIAELVAKSTTEKTLLNDLDNSLLGVSRPTRIQPDKFYEKLRSLNAIIEFTRDNAKTDHHQNLCLCATKSLINLLCAKNKNPSYSDNIKDALHDFILRNQKDLDFESLHSILKKRPRLFLEEFLYSKGIKTTIKISTESKRMVLSDGFGI